MIGSGNARRSALLLFLAVVITVLAPCSYCKPEYRSITILHTNDTHGHLLPFRYPAPCTGAEGFASMPVINNIGGIARRATLFHRIEAENKGGVLEVDAGDELDGTPFSVEYHGKADFSAMLAAGYDAMTPGNHEFSASLDQFKRNFQIASFVVSANIVDRSTGKLAFAPYRIYDLRGVKVGVFGLTIPVPDYTAAKAGYDFIDPTEAAKKIMPALLEKSDIIIAVTHLGTEWDRLLANQVPGIDVIIGGHSHTRLAQPVLVPTVGDKQFSHIGGTIIVQDYQWGGELGRLDLKVERDGGPFTVDSYSEHLIPVSSNIPDDPATAKVVNSYFKPIASKYDAVIGNAAKTFYFDDGRLSVAMHLVCDGIRSSTGAHIAAYNQGGVRSDILRGPIKGWDIATMLPFGDDIVEYTLSGARLKKFIQDAMPGVSGMRYHIQGGKLVDARIDGQPIKDDVMYSIAMNDYLGEVALGDVKPSKELETNVRSAVVNYIKARKTVSPVLDGRELID